MQGDRPAVVVHEGWRVYVNIHDAEYLRQRQEWRQRLSAAHSDHGGTDAETRRLLTQYRRWQSHEAQWYAELGLKPPKAGRENAIPTASTRQPEVARLLEMAGGNLTSCRVEIVEYLRTHPDATAKELASAFGLTLQRASTWLARIHARTERRPAPKRLLEVLLDGATRDRQEIARRANINARYITTFIRRLRDKGFVIEQLFQGRARSLYRLVSIPDVPLKGPVQ